MVNWVTINCTILRQTQSPLSAVICDSVRFSIGYAEQRCSGFLIPYYTVSNHDLLEVFKPQKIVINNKIIKKVLIGISSVNIDGVKIILNKEAL